MTDKTRNVLFLCTGNSARSVMAEALLNVLGAGRFRAFSAGSHPSGRVQPLAAELAAAIGYDTSQLRSKSWDEFAAPGAPPIDLVVTVCDNAAGEACPVWPGHPAKVHVGFPDPAAAEGTDEERLAVFRDVYGMIEAKVRKLIALGPERAGDL